MWANNYKKKRKKKIEMENCEPRIGEGGGGSGRTIIHFQCKYTSRSIKSHHNTSEELIFCVKSH